MTDSCPPPRRLEDDPRHRGRVVRYEPARRYGFIRADTGERAFFHHGALKEPTWIPQTGERVVFEREIGPQGLRAFDVRREA